MASALFDIFFLSGPTPSANDLSPINEEPLRSCALLEEKYTKNVYIYIYVYNVMYTNLHRIHFASRLRHQMEMKTNGFAATAQTGQKDGQRFG